MRFDGSAVQGAVLSGLLLASCNQIAFDEALPDVPEDEEQREVMTNQSTVNEGHECLTDEPGAFQWHSCNGPDSVQYGLPGSDFRVFRMDCRDGVISLAFPIPLLSDPRENLSVDFGDGELREGEEIELGDGANALISFGEDDGLPPELVASDNLEFRFEEASYSLPVGRGRELIVDLIETCER